MRIFDEYKKRKEFEEVIQDPDVLTGFGDSVEIFTKKTGIKKLVKNITGDKGCGCYKRKEVLNKLFPYGK